MDIGRGIEGGFKAIMIFAGTCFALVLLLIGYIVYTTFFNEPVIESTPPAMIITITDGVSDTTYTYPED